MNLDKKTNLTRNTFDLNKSECSNNSEDNKTNKINKSNNDPLDDSGDNINEINSHPNITKLSTYDILRQTSSVPSTPKNVLLDESMDMRKLQALNLDKINFYNKPGTPIDKINNITFNTDDKINNKNNKDKNINNNINPHVKKKEYIIEDLDRPWNYMIMRQLKEMGEKALGYKWMHNQDMIFYTTRNKYASLLEGILLAIIGTVTGSEAIALFTEQSNEAFIIFTCVQVFLYLLYSIIKIAREARDYPNLINAHRNAFISFDQISREIKNQFSLSIDKRDNDCNFLSYKSDIYSNILKDAPVIRQTTRQTYYEGTKDSSIFKPLSIGDVDKIEIVVDKMDDTFDIHNIEKEEIENKLDEKFRYEMDRFMKIY